jgi:hypothetical protein
MTDKPPAKPEPVTPEGYAIAWHSDPDRCLCGSVFPGQHLCSIRETR